MNRGLVEISFLVIIFLFQLHEGLNKRKHQEDLFAGGTLTSSVERAAWENQLLGDPATGQIPLHAQSRALEYSKSLPSESALRSDLLQWEWVGPGNVGGRTRALQIDRTDAAVIIAGAASGGIFRSEDGGKTWQKVSKADHNLAITSIAQDPNSGKENEWYACTGELRGGRQISGNSAYAGDGILKSVDGGKSWNKLASISNPSPQSADSTDHGWRVIVRHGNSEVYFASGAGILKSDDGGDSWKYVLGSKSIRGGYTDVIQTKTGILYASLGSGNFNAPGLYRSTDGDNWVRISVGELPSNVGRQVLAVDEQFNGERLYILAETPNAGTAGADFRGRVEYHSLYKYTYLTGDGAGSNGKWENLSGQIPVGPNQFDDYISQAAYCMDIAVSPFDSNVVIIGGTNLYISKDAFSSTDSTTYAGGYGETTQIPDFLVYENHHPDLQTIIFHPTDRNVLYTGSDGGIHRCDDLYADSIIWTSLNDGYPSTQFYAIAIDELKVSDRIMGGMQDNGTYLSLSSDPATPWTMPLSYDGGYCAFSDTEPYIYASKQLDGIAKIELDAQGNRRNWIRIDPATTANYLFINPYTLDPLDHNIMYVPVFGALWINDKLNEFIPDGSFNKQTKNWNSIGLPSGFQPSALVVDRVGPHSVYMGSDAGSLIRILDPLNNPSIVDLSSNLDGRGYINSISINPDNAAELLVVFSNYNTYSVYHSLDSGNTFHNISGNLEGTPLPNLPPQLAYINDGPSCRVGEIVPLQDTTLYLIGTSVGLFSCTKLDSMNTSWSKFGEVYLENNVISDIKYRKQDGLLAVSTFGAGIFRSFIKNYGDLVSTENAQAQSKFRPYPNPSNEKIEVNTKEPLRFTMYSVGGTVVSKGNLLPGEFISTSQLPSGNYILELKDKANAVKRFKQIVQH